MPIDPTATSSRRPVERRSRFSNRSLLQARFGIGDVYFCAISWGKLEVIEARSSEAEPDQLKSAPRRFSRKLLNLPWIEDPMGIKRLSHHALHCPALGGCQGLG